jgi:hypothetical protein
MPADHKTSDQQWGHDRLVGGKIYLKQLKLIFSCNICKMSQKRYQKSSCYALGSCRPAGSLFCTRCFWVYIFSNRKNHFSYRRLIAAIRKREWLCRVANELIWSLRAKNFISNDQECRLMGPSRPREARAECPRLRLESKSVDDRP